MRIVYERPGSKRAGTTKSLVSAASSCHDSQRSTTFGVTLTARWSLPQGTGFENSRYGDEPKPQNSFTSAQHVARASRSGPYVENPKLCVPPAGSGPLPVGRFAETVPEISLSSGSFAFGTTRSNPGDCSSGRSTRNGTARSLPCRAALSERCRSSSAGSIGRLKKRSTVAPGSLLLGLERKSFGRGVSKEKR